MEKNALLISALSMDARMAVATAAEHSPYRRGCLGNAGDVKRLKRSEIEVVLGSLGVFQDAKMMFKGTAAWPWQYPLKTGGELTSESLAVS